MKQIKLSACLILILINLILFLIQNLFFDLTQSLALYFPDNKNFQVWQIVSYMFIHSNFFHFFLNSFVLWVFGNVMESYWGSKKFIIFYLICGIGAGLIYSLIDYYQFYQIYNKLMLVGLTPDEVSMLLADGKFQFSLLSAVSQAELQKIYAIYHSVALGASGAIYGILAAFAIKFPNMKLFLIFLPIPIKAKYFLPLIILFDLFFVLTDYSIGNIAHSAHIGGAFCGLVLALLMDRKIFKKLYNR